MKDDTISRQAVLKLLSTIPAEEAITKAMLIQSVKQMDAAQPSGPDNLVKDSQGLAKDLVNDCISRQAAIDEIKKCRNESDMPDMWYDGMSCALRCIYQLPSAQPETHDKRTETHACDNISRQAMLDLIEDDSSNGVYSCFASYEDAQKFKQKVMDLSPARPERLTDDDFETIRIHLSAFKEKLCNQHRWNEAEYYERLINRFMSFASAQPEITEEQVREYCRKRCLSVVGNELLAKYINGCQDTISRRAAIEALGKDPGFKARLFGKSYDEGRSDQWFKDVYKLTTVPSAQPEQQWIPCSVRLPIEEFEEGRKNGTVYDIYPCLVTRYSTHTDVPRTRIYVCKSYFDGEDFMLHGGYAPDEGSDTENILAWMPLPEPYKGEKHG